MALQTSGLKMLGLGVQNDAPPDTGQPTPLVDGVHLRWESPSERGFPRYGFYLFRRAHRGGDPRLLSVSVGTEKPTGNQLDTDLGRLTSDVNLVLRDDFPPSGAMEFDLDGRDHLRFELPPGELARRIEVRIGFRRRQGEPPTTKKCVSFANRPNESWKGNTKVEQGVKFETFDQDGEPRPRIHVRERQIQGDRISGLDCEWALVITLPDVCSSVELTLTPLGSPATVEAYNEDGTSAGTTATSGNRRRPETVRLTGRAVNRVVVRARQAPPASQTLLNQICFERVATSRIPLTAFLGDVPVGGADAEGRPGEIVIRSLEFDAISAVEIGGGPGALVELGIVSVSQDAAVGWEQIPGFSYPLRLPVTHPDYPCTPGQGEDLRAARALARERVLYGDPNVLTGEPAPIHSAGTVSVVHGSPVVTGSGTGWEPDLAGATLRLDGDATAYVIAAVLAPDKLVLGRDYGGVAGSSKVYAIVRDDHFAHLHDHLTHLVAGGTAAGPMHVRYQPVPAHDEGTISVTEGSSTVAGAGTGWDAALEDLGLSVTESRGTVSITEDEPEVVKGSGTNWGSDLAGQTFEVSGEQTQYTVVRVDSPNRLTLDQSYRGTPGSGKGYTITGPAFYTVASVDSPFAASGTDGGQLRLSSQAGGVELRLVSPDGAEGHRRYFLPDDAYAPVNGARVLRKADGTGFFLLVPAASSSAGTHLSIGQYRLGLTYRRDNRNADSESLVLSQAGNAKTEEARIDVPWSMR